MKTAFCILIATILAMSTVVADQVLERDFGGNCDSFIDGWGEPATTGAYGGEDKDNFCMVIEKSCSQEDKEAYTNLNFREGANTVCIRHLDGLSNRDSFDVYIDDVKVFTYTDLGDGVEEWYTTCFGYNSDGPASRTIKIVATDAIWDSCETYGQLAIDFIRVEYREIPEFTTIGAAIALIGALGIFLYRRK